MRLVALAVYDVKAEVYLPPFCVRTLNEGLRTFESLLSDSSTMFHKYPGDFRLFRVGEFHQDTGVLVPLKEGVQLLEEGLALVKEA